MIFLAKNIMSYVFFSYDILVIRRKLLIKSLTNASMPLFFPLMSYATYLSAIIIIFKCFGTVYKVKDFRCQGYRLVVVISGDMGRHLKMHVMSYRGSLHQKPSHSTNQRQHCLCVHHPILAYLRGGALQQCISLLNHLLYCQLLLYMY